MLKTIKITRKGVTPQMMIGKMEVIGHGTNLMLSRLGDKTVDMFRKTIQVKRKRPSTSNDRLAKSITKEVGGVGISYWVGIANIYKMPYYWQLANDGGIIPKSFKGSFAGQPPDRALIGKGTDPVFYDNQFFIKPKTVTRPLKFVETVINRLRVMAPVYIEYQVSKLLKSGKFKIVKR